MTTRELVYQYLDKDDKCTIKDNVVQFIDTTCGELNREVNELFGLSDKDRYVLDWMDSKVDTIYRMIEVDGIHTQHSAKVETLMKGNIRIERIITINSSVRKVFYEDNEENDALSIFNLINDQWVEDNELIKNRKPI